MEGCFDYYKTSKAMTEDSYPYTGSKDSCKYSAPNGVVQTTGYQYADSNGPVSMLEALKVQPLTIGIAASSEEFNYYSSGILSSKKCGTWLDHAVILIGYGQDSKGTLYWIIKNSWGTSWGEKGYGKILRDKTVGGAGICGVNQWVVYPTIA